MEEDTEMTKKIEQAEDDNFDSSVIEAAWAYHVQIRAGPAKGCVPVEVAAFIAGACWAKQAFNRQR